MTTAHDFGLRLRPAGEEDARGLAVLWAEAFPGEPRVEHRLRALHDGTGPFGGLENCWVAEVGGQRVGGLRQYPLEMYLHGRACSVQGLAAVAVAPEHRRRGMGRQMCREAMLMARRSGAPMSALFPFRADFYASLGYVLTGELHRYRFATADLPVFPGHERVRPVRDQERMALLPSLYDWLLPRSHGLVTRSRAMWEDRFEGAGMVQGLFSEDGELEGYLLARGVRGRSPERDTLRVQELVARDLDAWRSLLGWLSTQRDQWPRAYYDAVPDECFHQILPHPRLPGMALARGLWFPSAFLLRGPMLRILDVPEMLGAAGLPEGSVIPVVDPEIEENTGRWRVEGGDVARVNGTANPRGALPSNSPPGPSAGTPPGPAPGTSPDALSIRLLTELVVKGTLPGQVPMEWDPALGIRDFRLLDVF